MQSLTITIVFIIFVSLMLMFFIRLDKKYNVLLNSMKMIEKSFQRPSTVEKISATDSPSEAPEQRSMTGLEFLERFATSHQIRLEEVESNDEEFKLFNFSYQGDYFTIWASQDRDSIYFRTGVFATYPCNENTYWAIMRYCYDFTCNNSFVKVNFKIDKPDLNHAEMHLFLAYEMIAVSQEAFEYLLSFSYATRRHILQEIQKMFEELQIDISSDETNSPSDQTINAQELAMKMMLEKAKSQKNNNSQNESADDNFSY